MGVVRSLERRCWWTGTARQATARSVGVAASRSITSVTLPWVVFSKGTTAAASGSAAVLRKTSRKSAQGVRVSPGLAMRVAARWEKVSSGPR